MPSIPLTDIPRRPYALGMLFAAVLAIAAGIGAAALAGPDGGQSGVVIAISLTLLAGLALCALPLAGPPLVTPERWGLMVLMASVARTMLVLLALVVLVEGQGLPRKPVGFGLLTGTLILMFAEAAIAVNLLMKRERLRDAGGPGVSASRKTSSHAQTSPGRVD